MRSIFYPIYILVLLVLASCNQEKASNQSDSETNAEPVPTQPEEKKESRKTIVFFGNSLTAGYGLTPDEKGYVDIIQERLDKAEYNYQAVNSGLSGETTSGGNSRIDWILEQQNIDIFVLELGGNDGLRGIKPQVSLENLKSIVKKVKAENPEVRIILAGMEAPPNMGDDYTGAFRAMYPEVAKEFDTALIPFLLDGVGGIPELNQRDGIHPTAEGHKILADNVWKTLEPLL